MVGSLLLYPRGNAYYNIAYYEEKDNFILKFDEFKENGEELTEKSRDAIIIQIRGTAK